MSTISQTGQYQQATIQYVYDTITESWTTYSYPVPLWDLEESPVDHRLYAASASTAYPFVFQERKSFTRLDFADVELSTTIVSFSGTTVTLSSTSNVTIGWSLVQILPATTAVPARVLNLSIITAILNATQITVADVISWDLSGASSTFLEQPISIAVRYCPISGTGASTNSSGNPGIVKNFKEVQFLFQNIQFSAVNVSFSSDFIGNTSVLSLIPVSASSGWGQFQWGQAAWGGVDPFAVSAVRTYVPLYARRAHWLNLSLSLAQAMVGFTYGGCVVNYQDVTTRSK